MPLNFPNTAYLKAVQDIKELKGEIVSELKYHYSKVTYADYCKNYNSKGWFARKVVAIPFAATLLVVEGVNLIFFSIHVGISTAMGNYKDIEFKRFTYYLARDFQVIMGVALTIFKDSYGCFLVDEADFQRSCYNANRNPALLDDLSKTEKKQKKAPQIFVNIPQELKNISLFDCKEFSKEELDNALRRNKLENYIYDFEKTYNITFMQFLEKVPDELLKQLSFTELYLPKERSVIKYLLMEESELAKLTFESYPNSLTTSGQKVFKSKLLDIYKTHPEQYKIGSINTTTPLIHFLSLTPEEMAKNWDVIPLEGRAILTNEQLSQLDFAKLSRNDLVDLLETFTLDDTINLVSQLNIQNLKALWSIFPLESPYEDVEYRLRYALVLPENVKMLTFAELPKDFLHWIFPTAEKTQDKYPLQYEIFQSYPHEDVLKGLKEEHVSEYLFHRYASDELKQKLKFSDLPKGFQGYHLFRDNQLFEKFTSEEVNVALQNGFNPFLVGTYATPEQYKAIQLSLLPKAFMRALFPLINWNQENASNASRFAQLDGKEVYRAWLKDLLDETEKFPYWYNSLLRGDALRPELITHITKDQFKEFDFSACSADQAHKLFPRFSIDFLREQLKESTFFTIKDGVVVKHDTEQQVCRYTDDELQEKSDKIKGFIRDKFESLSNEQRVALMPKLGEEYAPWIVGLVP